MPVRSLLAGLLVFGLASGAAAAPTPFAGRVVGTVSDAISGETLIGASVRILGTSIGDATDLDGRYSIPNAPSGDQQLVVSYVGYESDTLAVTVVDGETVTVDVALGSATFDEVTVTAQVAGQLAAINEQFRDRTVVNVVSADRIQEMPDNNAAESIGRLPGVSIQRSGGEATKVAVRGLSPKFNNVSVNGVRLAGTDGNDRSVDLSLVSSNILDGIEVRKSITPDMDADAIGGSVNLRLKSAPNERSLDLLAQGGYTGLQGTAGNYKVVGSASDRFFGDRVGLIASFNTDSYDRSADKLGVGYGRGSATDGSNEARLFVSSLNPREESVTRGRTGGSLLADLRLPNGRATANVFYNRLSNDGLFRFQNVTDGSLTYNVQDRASSTDLITAALGAEQDFGWLRYDASANLSTSRARSPEDLSWTFSRTSGGGLVQGTEARYDIRPQDVEVRVDSAAVLSSLWVDDTALDENQVGLQLNVAVPFRVGTWGTGYVKTGGKLRWLDRTFDTNRFGRQGLQFPNADLYDCLAAGVPRFADQFGDGSLQIADLLLAYDRGAEFLDGEFGLGLVADRDALLEITRGLQSDACADPGDTPFVTEFAGQYLPEPIASLGRDYDGTEAYQAAYVMAELSLGELVTVIPGVRYERDESTYNGQRFKAELRNGQIAEPPAELEALRAERSNAFVLPMVHLDVRPMDWLSVRLSRTETLARPSYNQYAPITSVDAFRFAIQAGNSTLRPSPATNYDASVQIVRGTLGLVGLSAFHKTIDDLVLDVSIPVNEQFPPFEGTNVPPSFYEGAVPFLQTSINNEAPTTFYGFEAEWQTNFSYLPGLLKGLVLNLNYTRSFSETTYITYRLDSRLVPGRPPRQEFTFSDTTRTGRMPDQAAHIANVTLGYDYRGFSTRLSYLFQSNTASFVSPLQPLQDTFVGDYARFDLSIRQKVRDGFEVFANLNNLNNRPDQSFTDQDSQAPGYVFRQDALSYRELYGFTADLGVRYRW